MREKDFSKIETKNEICINVYCHENKLTFPVYISDQKFENLIDLLLVTDESKSHLVYIKYFDRFIFNKTKNKKNLYKSCLQCSRNTNVLKEHKEVCLSINGAQSVRLENVTNEFKIYFKQIPVSFKIYADFERNLESIESYEGSYAKKYQNHISCSFAYKLICVNDKISKPFFVLRGENAAYEFKKSILKEY